MCRYGKLVLCVGTVGLYCVSVRKSFYFHENGCTNVVQVRLPGLRTMPNELPRSGEGPGRCRPGKA